VEAPLAERVHASEQLQMCAVGGQKEGGGRGRERGAAC
jgi:hypothetical protein